MKLLLCGYCDDIFNLRYHYKECTCGKTAGAYITFEKAVYSGDNLACLALHNHFFKYGVSNRFEEIHFGDRIFHGWSVPENTANFTKVDNVKDYINKELSNEELKHIGINGTPK